MQETVGTLTLKIARLQHQLQVLHQQQQMGKIYPEFQAAMLRRRLVVEHQLGQLRQNKEELQHVIRNFSPEPFNGEHDGAEPFYTIN